MSKHPMFERSVDVTFSLLNEKPGRFIKVGRSKNITFVMIDEEV
jgi:hypothetical protein